MDPNPYRPPVVVEAPFGKSQQPEIFVDGKYLVVPSGTVLPPSCVKTNQKITDREMRQKVFEWCSPWVALSFLISGCILIVLYFVLRKRCELVFGVHPSVRSRYRRRAMVKALATAICFVGILVAAAADYGPLIAVACVLFILAMASNFLGNTPLSIAKYRNGRFWIRGCCPEFLAQFEGGYGPPAKPQDWG